MRLAWVITVLAVVSLVQRVIFVYCTRKSRLYFSQCLAYQCAQVLTELGAGSILELGAGTGVMARDLLLELEKLDLLPEHYYILEVSADLKQRQQQLLKQSIPHLFQRISWLDALPEGLIRWFDTGK